MSTIIIRLHGAYMMNLIELYFFVCSLICTYFLFLSVRNAITLDRLSFPPHKISSPRISVLIPARNEESNLPRCLDSLLEQDYDNYEIIVIDDNSTDNTGKIIGEYARKSPRITGLASKPLPEGWNGKAYACQQMAERAVGDYLVFTDADTIHGKSSLSWIVTNLENHSADFMSAYVQHTIGSIGEAILVPIVYLLTTLMIPIWLIPRKNHPFITFAIGQLLVIKRGVYRSINGFYNVRNNIVEDLSLARFIKSLGFKTIFLDAKDHVSCRMYASYKAAYNGLSRAIFTAIDKSLIMLLGLVLLIFAVIEFPVIFLADSLKNGSFEYIINAAVPAGLFLLAWLVMLSNRRLPLYLAVLYPVLFTNILVIAIVSYLKTGIGKGVDWKGRLVKCETDHYMEEDPRERKI
jgi:chlorobactene glucosyltransferase